MLAKVSGLVARLNFFGNAAKEGKSESLWVEFKDVFINEDFLKGEFLFILLFLAGCVGLTVFAKRLHRRFAFARILRTTLASGGGKPRKIDLAVKEAVAQHDITYASTVRRMAGAAIDFAIVYLVAVLLFVPFVPSVSIMYVLTKGSETVTGSYPEEFEDNRVSVHQGTGANIWTLSFTESVTHKTPSGQQSTRLLSASSLPVTPKLV